MVSNNLCLKVIFSPSSKCDNTNRIGIICCRMRASLLITGKHIRSSPKCLSQSRSNTFLSSCEMCSLKRSFVLTWRNEPDAPPTLGDFRIPFIASFHLIIQFHIPHVFYILTACPHNIIIMPFTYQHVSCRAPCRCRCCLQKV